MRVVRRSRHHVVVGLGIQLTRGRRQHLFLPAARVRAGLDEAALLARASSSATSTPSAASTGATSAAGATTRRACRRTGFRDRRPDGRRGARLRARAATGSCSRSTSEAILFVTRMSENLAAAHPARASSTATTRRTPTRRSTCPGTRAARRLTRDAASRSVPGGRYTFALRIFVLDRYRRGDERRVLAQLDAPPSRPSRLQVGSASEALPQALQQRLGEVPDRLAIAARQVRDRAASRLMRMRWPVWKIDGASTSSGGKPGGETSASSKPAAKLPATTAITPAAASAARGRRSTRRRRRGSDPRPARRRAASARRERRIEVGEEIGLPPSAARSRSARAGCPRRSGRRRTSTRGR